MSDTKLRIAYARAVELLSATAFLDSNDTVNSRYVREFQSIIDLVSGATGLDLSGFDVLAFDVEAEGAAANRESGRTPLSRVNGGFFKMKLRAFKTFFELEFARQISANKDVQAENS